MQLNLPGVACKAWTWKRTFYKRCINVIIIIIIVIILWGLKSESESSKSVLESGLEYCKSVVYILLTFAVVALTTWTTVTGDWTMKTGVLTNQCCARGTLIDVRLMPPRQTLPLICRPALCVSRAIQHSRRGLPEERSVVRNSAQLSNVYSAKLVVIFLPSYAFPVLIASYFWKQCVQNVVIFCSIL